MALKINMVTVRFEDELPPPALDFLKDCYQFVNSKWPHLDRLDLPDQGFERKFRDACVRDVNGWNISYEREMHLGTELFTASGVLHEIDIVARHSDAYAILELKNRQVSPTKNDIIGLFAKILDYLALNPRLLLKEVCPIFLSTASFEPNALAVCLGLGIHPIGPMLRPAHILLDNARRMHFEFTMGTKFSQDIEERFHAYCMEINKIFLDLGDNWIGSRFGYLSEDAMVVRAAQDPEIQNVAHLLVKLNSDCDWLLNNMREVTR